MPDVTLSSKYVEVVCVGCQSCEITPCEDKSPWRLTAFDSSLFFQMQRDAFANPAGLRPVSGRRFAMLAQNSESSQKPHSPWSVVLPCARSLASRKRLHYKAYRISFQTLK